MWNGSGSGLQMAVLRYVGVTLGDFVMSHPLSDTRVSAYSRLHLHRALHEGTIREFTLLHSKSHALSSRASRGDRRSLILLPVSDCVQNSTVTERAKNFRSVQYLLVHGTADGELQIYQQYT